MQPSGKNQQNQNEAFDATEAPEMLAIVIADQARSLSSAERMFNPTKNSQNESTKGKMAARFILLGAKTLIKPPKHKNGN